MDVWIWRGLFIVVGLIIIALATKETTDKDLPWNKKDKKKEVGRFEPPTP